MSTGSAIKMAFTGPGALTRVAGVGLLLGTLASQHPSAAFSRVQQSDRFSALFPNWRFFAPTPVQHDFELFYRTLNTADETSGWKSVPVVQGRTARQLVWFPERRDEKTVFDFCNELQGHLDGGFDTLATLPSYRLLTGYLRRLIERREGSVEGDGGGEGGATVKGFQFTLAKTTGHDESTEPEIVFVSPYTSMTPVETGAEAPTPSTSRTSP